jgi:hypothetical protein
LAPKYKMADWKIFPTSDDYPPAETAQTIVEEIKSEPVQLGQSTTGSYRQLYGGPIIYRIKNSSAWYNLNEAVVEVRFCLANPDATGMDLTDVSTLISGGFHLFSRAELYAGGTELIEAVDWPGFVHSQYAAARYSPSRLAQAADFEFIYPSAVRESLSSDTQVILDPLNIPAAGDANVVTPALTSMKRVLGMAAHIDFTTGTAADDQTIETNKFDRSFQRRFDRTKASANGVSQIVTLMLPLRAIFGFCDNLAHPLRGAPVELRLYKNTDYNTIIHSVEGIDEKQTVILTSSLWVPNVQPIGARAAVIEEEISKKAATTYLFENRNTYISNTYPTGPTAQNIDWRINTVNDKPVAMFVAFQHEAQFTEQADVLELINPIDDSAPLRQVGAYSQYDCSNGGIFSKLNNIYRVEARIANKSYPVESYTLDFADESPMRAYCDFLDLFYKVHPENARMMNYETWRQSPIFAFKFDDDSIFLKVKAIEVGMRARVLSNEAGDFRVIATVVTERQFYRASDGKREIFST